MTFELKSTRRSVLAGGAAMVGALAAPGVLRAQPAAVKLGVVHPVTGFAPPGMAALP